MTSIEHILQPWLQDDVKIRFVTDLSGSPEHIGKLSERCETGVFFIIEGDEYFMPWANILWIKRIREEE